MNTVFHIRKNVLALTQVAFSKIAGTTQATVCRWEAGELQPDLEQLRKIRNEVIAQGKPWDDTWFFEVPISEPAE